jgi:hypothetical protein
VPFNLRMGVPEMASVWSDLSSRHQQGKMDRDEEKYFRKLVKALAFLGENPRHPSLQTPEINALTDKYGFKVFEAYLENGMHAAGRVFWAYGPDRGDITILAVEPHPDDKRAAYLRIRLSRLPSAKPMFPKDKKSS